MLPLSGLRGCKTKPRDAEDFSLSEKGADGALWTDCTTMGGEARRKKYAFGILPGTREQDGCCSDKSSVSKLQGLEGQRKAEGAEQPCQCTPKLLQLPRKSAPSAQRTQDDGEVTGFGNGATADHKDGWQMGQRKKGCEPPERAHRLAYGQEERRWL